MVEQDKKMGNYDVTKGMVEKFPLCVYSADKHGNTLYHYAVRNEDDKLLQILLGVSKKKKKKKKERKETMD